MSEVTKEWVLDLISQTEREVGVNDSDIYSMVRNNEIDIATNYEKQMHYIEGLKERINTIIQHVGIIEDKMHLMEDWMVKLQDELTFRGVDVEGDLKILFNEFPNIFEEHDEVGDNDGG